MRARFALAAYDVEYVAQSGACHFLAWQQEFLFIGSQQVIALQTCDDR